MRGPLVSSFKMLYYFVPVLVLWLFQSVLCISVYAYLSVLYQCVIVFTLPPMTHERMRVVRRGSEWFLGDIAYFLPILSPAVQSSYTRLFMTM